MLLKTVTASSTQKFKLKVSDNIYNNDIEPWHIKKVKVK